MKLYGYRNGRTLRVLWTLEELGLTYDYVEVDVMRGEGRSPSFLELNPAGKVPVLDDDGKIITESAAICIHLAETHPQLGLLSATGTPERAQCHKWISYILTELDAPLWTIAKHRFGLPRERRVPAVIETAGWEFRNAARILASAIEGKLFLVGTSLTVADILAGHTLLWARSARVAFDGAALETYLEGLLARDAAIRAREVAKESA